MTGLNGIDALTFGVESLDEAHDFLRDWGLRLNQREEDFLSFRTRDNGEIVIRLQDDPSLPPAMQSGSTLRQVVWGVTAEAQLDVIAARLGEKAMRVSGLLQADDPNGLRHAFRASQRVEIVADAQEINGPGAPRRVDRRSTMYDQASPISIGHVVLFIDDLEASTAFYTALGFAISDTYPGHAAFLRARTPGPHHDVFILRRPGVPGLNHVAFTVSNIDEVFGGGLAMSRKGWPTEIGPGRHPISSAYFWYFKSPFGGALEYYADDDYCTENWEPKEFERRPELFAEWAINGGLDGTTRRQARGA